MFFDYWGVGRGDLAVDYFDWLRRVAINDDRLFGEFIGAADWPAFDSVLDPKTRTLVRLAAMIAVGAAGPSFGAQVDTAVSAGATAAEIVDVLISVVPIVGYPRVVAAAPELALALGHDVNEDLED